MKNEILEFALTQFILNDEEKRQLRNIIQNNYDLSDVSVNDMEIIVDEELYKLGE